MTLRLSILLSSILAATLVSPTVERPASEPDFRYQEVSDSALEELEVGRYWHAARMMRAEGALEGGPADILLLARAEAGWLNWPAVRSLLEGADWLAHLDGGRGLYLAARALDFEEDHERAAELYAAYEPLGIGTIQGMATSGRLARSLWLAGRPEEAIEALARLPESSAVRSWMAAELALEAAEDGDVASTRALTALTVDPVAARPLWRAEADAQLAAGDTVAATSTFETLRLVSTGARAAAAGVELGRLKLAAGDSAAAQPLFEVGFAEAEGRARSRAAAGLVDLGSESIELLFELGRALDRAGDGRRALEAYDRARELSTEAGEAFPEATRLERARMMATVESRQSEALEEFRAIRETTTDDRIGARNLQVWMGMRRRQGMTAQVSTLRGWLLAEYPTSGQAAELAWELGANADAAGRLDQALGHYRYLAENVRTHARAGQARMRAGQIHLRRSDVGAAAEVFEAYLDDFPTGRRWQEASYWAGWTRMQLGDTALARQHLERVANQPVEYYALIASEMLERPYELDLPPGPAPETRGWLTTGLRDLDALTEAGLDRGATAVITEMKRQAGGDTPGTLAFADALLERGRTIDGINLGWSLFAANDNEWNESILRVTYPFPYQELVRREAAEWGIDPLMMAAIIRQESAFKADIVSPAGAIGLMQVMPPTGAQLARAHGPSGFTRESLTKPEVNLHLGAAFFVDMSRRYDNDLPLVLSAYNAGPTRATRWRRYPEASDPLRFTERIPFTETRGYVKNVRRNLGLYRLLYGQD